ncbi:MAG: tetratricopeptide repeat protein [Pseudomonadota bacterium]
MAILLMAPGVALAAEAGTPEYRAAFAAMQADPGSGDKALAFAKIAIETGDIEGALSALERLLIFNPDLPRIRTEIGILYYRLGSYEEARAYLRRVIEDSTLPAEDRQRAEDFLSRTERGASNWQWRAAVTSGMRYQSNANFGPTTGLARLIGFDFPISGLGQKRADWAFFGAYGGQVTYDPNVNDWALPFVIEANMNGFGQKQFKREDLDLFYVQPDVGPRFRLDFISQGLTVRPYGMMNYFTVQANNFLMSSGGRRQRQCPGHRLVPARREFRIAGSPLPAQPAAAAHRGPHRRLRRRVDQAGLRDHRQPSLLDAVRARQGRGQPALPARGLLLDRRHLSVPLRRAVGADRAALVHRGRPDPHLARLSYRRLSGRSVPAPA